MKTIAARSSKLLSSAMVVLICIVNTSANAQWSLTGASYTQNFDSLATSGTSTFANNTTLPGFYAYQTGGTNSSPAAAGTPTTYLSGTGSVSTGSLYSFGSTGSSERAFGSVAAGAIGGLIYALVLRNNTGADLAGFSLGYTGEQWRNGGNMNPQSLGFAYFVDATGSDYSIGTLTGNNYTADTALTFSTPVNSASSSALNGNAAANRTVLTDTINILIPAGSTLYLRFTDNDDAGNDHGLAIDDLTFTAIPVPEPTTILGALLLIGVAGWNRRRRCISMAADRAGH